MPENKIRLTEEQAKLILDDLMLPDKDNEGRGLKAKQIIIYNWREKGWIVDKEPEQVISCYQCLHEQVYPKCIPFLDDMNKNCKHWTPKQPPAEQIKTSAIEYCIDYLDELNAESPNTFTQEIYDNLKKAENELQEIKKIAEQVKK